MKMFLVLAPTLGLAADVLAHLMVTWSLRGSGVYFRLACGAAAGLAAGVAITLFASQQLGLAAPDAIAYVLSNVVTFLILSFGYFNLVQMNLSSLRLRLANELVDATDGVPAERLFAMYDGRSIVDARLARLSRGGQIVLRDGRYHHRLSLVFLIAVAMDTMKRIVFGRRIRDGFTKPPCG
jgi:hypothetical protein